MAIVRATGPLLDEIFDHTYPIWGDGLSRRAYAQWNQAQERTDWGRRHLMRVALVENGHLLATAKRYDLRLMLDGRVTPTVGIGAVFTPVALRGRGHARAIIDALMESARADGAELALLFSEIGPEYYERMGFTVIPIETADIQVATKPGAPAMLVRAGEDDDARHVAALYAQRASGFRLALVSDDDQVRYMVTKKRLFVGLDPGARRSVEVLRFRRRPPGGGICAAADHSGDRRTPRRLESRSLRRCRSKRRTHRGDPAGAARTIACGSAAGHSADGCRFRCSRRSSRLWDGLPQGK